MGRAAAAVPFCGGGGVAAMLPPYGAFFGGGGDAAYLQLAFRLKEPYQRTRFGQSQIYPPYLPTAPPCCTFKAKLQRNGDLIM